MKKFCSALLFASVVVSSSLTPAFAEVDVTLHIGPPPPIYERVPPPPGRAYVWHRGYYHWNGYRYVWIHGAYVREMNPNARWVSEHYEHSHGGGWHEVPGHMKREDRS
jgi:hypothetical protein